MSLVASFLWFFLESAQVLGAEEAHVAEPPWMDLLFSTINFVIFVYLLQRFLKEPVKKFFQERREGIVKSLNDASRNLKESQGLFQEMRSRVEGVDGEILSLREEVDRELDRERQKLIERARETAERIQRDAAMVAAQEISLAKQRLRLELADTAIEKARTLLSQRLTPDAERRIADEFISGLEVRT